VRIALGDFTGPHVARRGADEGRRRSAPPRRPNPHCREGPLATARRGTRPVPPVLVGVASKPVRGPRGSVQERGDTQS
jgi:hypothetical protein